MFKFLYFFQSGLLIIKHGYEVNSMSRICLNLSYLRTYESNFTQLVVPTFSVTSRRCIDTHRCHVTHVSLSGRIGKVLPRMLKVSRLQDRIPAVAELHRFARGAQGVLPMMVGGATSQLDLPSLTPLSVAGRGKKM